ncbi:HDAC1 [Ecytonucleospora hepatopenaei]|uniref:Histone deacetylase n=1 Tax=Ecytonucleospora hepatopenaei TaxID=646526 RepID=A0A1W0E6J5_9MICR|nr:HDAC1 [Ecytonucleospora hepatopenaei]
MKNVLYMHDDEIANYNYSKGHPMKPLRVSMTHSLVINYNLHDHMEIAKPWKASYENLLNFHTKDYINFLSNVSGDMSEELAKDLTTFNVKDDCPVFSGLFDYCRSVAGASLMAAAKINTNEYQTVINWSGGLHHAKRSEASGFCYINDIVLCILELLKVHERVLYVDIDVHHGDGVEEAFYCSNRVMTCSFHKFGDFFPGTGRMEDKGLEKGENFAVNVPLKDGIDDDSYEQIFVPVIQKIFEKFQPSAVILQCGADCLSGDKLGCFNLTEKGHGKCVEFVKSFNIPTILLGGGGYTIENVARAWAYDTGVALGINLDSDIPYNEFMDYYIPTYKLKIPKLNIENKNTKTEIENILSNIFINLEKVCIAPSVQMNRTPSTVNFEESDDETIYKKLFEENQDTSLDDIRIVN